MISGVHTIIYSKQPDADRAFLRDVLGLPHVDVGDGWLIFGLPPSEVAIHPGEQNGGHELYLMCDDVEKFIAGMSRHGISCTAAQNLGWGLRTQLSLPGGGTLGVYQPRHARPKSASPARPSAKASPSRKVKASPSRKAAPASSRNMASASSRRAAPGSSRKAAPASASQAKPAKRSTARKGAR
jgi:hypothetical protein